MHCRILVLLSLSCVWVAGFQIQNADQSMKRVEVGGSLRLTCTSSDYFEYCSWSHGDRECHLEWKMIKGKVTMQDCHSELQHKVSITGDYASHECGIEIAGLEERDAGNWTCEMEKYVALGGKGSGVTDKYTFEVEVELLTTSTATSTTTSTTTTTTTATTSSQPPPSSSTTTTTPLVSTTIPEEIDTEKPSDSDEEDGIEERIDEDYNNQTVVVTEKFVQIDGEDQTGGSMVGVICGVLVGVVAAGGILAGLLLWRRRRNRVQTVTMSKLIEENEALGTLLEENEFNSMPASESKVDRVLVNSLP